MKKIVYDRINDLTGEVISKGVRTINELPSRTQQHFKDDADINNIMKKYLKTGQVNWLKNKPGKYLDLSNMPKDYSEALKKVEAVETTFAAMSSEIRNRFQNNPQAMIEFMADDKNLEESYSLGLRIKPVPINNEPEDSKK